MLVHVPVQIPGGGFIDGGSNTRQVGGHVMLKTVFADVVQQLLHLGDFDYAGAAESVQRVIGKSAFAHISAHLAGCVVGGEAGKAHLFRLDQSHAGAESVFLAHGAGDNLLEIHLHRAEKVFGKVGAVKADRLVGIRTVVIVPVEQG